MAKPESYKQFHSAQEKYTYFLLTAAGSAIVFTIQKTDGRCFEWALIPLGIAILAWGFSFFFGCRHVTKKMDSLYTEIPLEELSEKSGKSQYGLSYVTFATTEYVDNTRMLIEEHFNEAVKYSHWQFIFMITGIVLYVVWYLLEMGIRTYQMHNFA